MISVNPAKRGDLAVVVTTHRDFVIGEGTRESVHVNLGVVTSVTRDGVVKRILDNWGSDRVLGMPDEVRLVPKAEVDAEACRAAMQREHTYPGHTTPMSFASIDEAREFVRRFLK